MFLWEQFFINLEGFILEFNSVFKFSLRLFFFADFFANNGQIKATIGYKKVLFS